ncbi:MAG: Protein of unknown function rane [Acidimicrobiales bacterium]|nr:Protein of unknown function rane [Acidimicrobiales bacterium]
MTNPTPTASDPAARRRTRLFLGVGLAFGLAFVALTPPFAAADEATHFFRAYQLSEGHLVATRRGDQLGGDLPGAVVRDVAGLDRVRRRTSLGALGPYWSSTTGGPRTFADFRNTAVYPPAGYLPQTAAILVGRVLGASTLVLLYAARLANLLVFLALAAVAARRFPSVRWLPLAVALTPMAVFQAASASSDAATTGLCLLVLASALGDRAPGRRGIVEAVVLGALLGLAKPPYVLMSLVFLAPRRGLTRDERLGAVGAVLVGFAVAALWSRTSTHLYVPYRPIIDVHLDIRPAAQLHRVVTAPWSFVSTLSVTTWESLGKWLRQAVTPVGRFPAAAMPLVAVVGSYALTVAAAVMPVPAIEAGDAGGPGRAARALAVAVGLVTLLAISVVVYAYADGVGARRVDGIYGRYLLPVLPALLLGLPRTRRRANDLAFVGIAAVLLAVGVAAVTHRAYGWPL